MVANENVQHLRNTTPSFATIRGQTGSTKASVQGDFDFLTDVIGVPDAAENLLSIAKECDLGKTVIFDKDHVKVYDSSAITITGQPEYAGSRSEDGLWRVTMHEPGTYPDDTETPAYISLVASTGLPPEEGDSADWYPERTLITTVTPPNIATTWHNRLNHCNIRTLKDMVARKPNNHLSSPIAGPVIAITKKDYKGHNHTLCVACAKGKQLNARVRRTRRHPVPPPGGTPLTATERL
jgi:hypothetical protein